MKKIISYLLIFSLIIFSVPAAFAADDIGGVSVSAKSAILINADSGEVLFEKDPDSRMLIASTTKIMTAVVVLSKCSMDDVVQIPAEAAEVEGSSAYLQAGEKLTVRELMYAMMLSSGNDAAAALAIHVSGSVDKFAEEMNKKADELGLENTSFKNPHGLDAEGHYSTARDLAKLTVYALTNKDFRDIVSTKTASVGSRTLTNHNKLLWSIDGAIGVKTGYTKAAGRVLVSAVERQGICLVCVTINDPDDWADHTSLYNIAFDSIKLQKVCTKGEVFSKIPVISGESDGVNIEFSEDITLTLDENDEVTAEVELPRFVYAGFSRSDTVGKVTFFVNGEEKASTELVFGNNINIDGNIRLSSFDKFKRLMRLSFKYGAQQYPTY